ncbi:hypothetical protein [Stackebrandtia soli]|uniref:hypothetical protein n=1 Tax=Stackebrandtia soli TaxID=1892856 RepID=UPI0039EAE7F1
MPINRRGLPPHPGCSPAPQPVPTAEELITATLEACEPYLGTSTALRHRLMMLDIRVREYYGARDTLWDCVDQVLKVLDSLDEEPESTDDTPDSD